MNKNKFIKELKNNFSGINIDQIDEIVADYNEHFEVGKEKGRTEVEISKSLGDPVTLGKQLSKQYKVDEVEAIVSKAEKNPNLSNITRAIFATAALGAFNIFFVLGPVLGIYGAILGVIAVSVSFVISGLSLSFISLASYLLPYTVNQIHPMVVFFAGIGVASFGVLLCLATYYLVKFSVILTFKYLKFNIKIINPNNE